MNGKKILYIFLDIDGVLNNKNNQINFGYNICLNNMNLFKNLLNILEYNKINTKIIITSDWRYNLNKLNDMINSFGIKDYDGYTKLNELKLNNTKIREKEINEYLKNNIKDIDFNYIIIDDFDLDIKNFIKINGDHGFTKNDLKKILSFLNLIKINNIGI